MDGQIIAVVIAFFIAILVIRYLINRGADKVDDVIDAKLADRKNKKLRDEEPKSLAEMHKKK